MIEQSTSTRQTVRRCVGAAGILTLFLVGCYLLWDGGGSGVPHQLPDPLISDSLGELSLSTKTIESGDRTLHLVAYRTMTQVPRHGTVDAAFYANLTWPYGSHTDRELQTQLQHFEELVSALAEKTPDHLVETLAPKIRKYAEDNHIPPSTAEPHEEPAQWQLDSATVTYPNERIGLVFSGNNAYPGYRLIVDFDFQWNMRSLMFDGTSTFE